MTDVEIDTLEAKAYAATSGPWRVLKENGWVVTDHVFIETDALPRNAEFIAAANPAAILELISQYRDAQRALACKREDSQRRQAHD